jgi:ribosomal protein S18 acetylase RimI-like enzyme
MPTCDVNTGRKSYVMNMYTDPEYRRQGIAYKTLDLLVADAKARGVEHITLEATDMGRPLYERYGFIAAGAEMLLPQEKM